MSYAERWTMVGLVVVTMALFLWVMRQQWSLWCLSDGHQEQIDKLKEGCRSEDTKLCKIDSQIIAMNRTYQERFDGVNRHMAEHGTALDAASGVFKAVEESRADTDRRLGLVDEQLTRLERLREESSLRGKTAMGRIDAVDNIVMLIQRWLNGEPTASGMPAWMVGVNGRLNNGVDSLSRLESDFAKRVESLEQKQAPDDFKDWRQEAGQALAQHASILDGILGKLDATDRRLANWPTEIRSEVATAYRDMADAIDRAELAEASA